MRRNYKIFFTALILFSLCIPGFSQKADDTMNMRKISDDMKFATGEEFYRLREYHKALNILNEYLEVYYDGIHRSEAYRKIADIHIKDFNYQKAVSVYQELYLEFSNSDEGVDAYFQTAICYKKMGFDEKAVQIFDYIIKEHPGTTAAYHSEIQRDLIKIYSE